MVSLPVTDASPLAAVVAVADYDFREDLPNIRSAAEQLSEVLAKAGYALPNPDYLDGGKHIELAPRLDNWFRSAPDRSVLVFYWTGHGEIRGGKHYLLCTDSPATGVTSLNSFGTEALGEAIANSGAEKVFLIIDTCFSGTGTLDVMEAFDAVMKSFPPVPGQSRALSIIGTSHPLRKVPETVFLDRLIKVLTEPAHDLPWTDNSPLIQPEEIALAVQGRMEKDGLEVNLTFRSAGLGTRFVRNPRFQPELPVETAELALLRAEGDPPAPSSLFVGRARMLDMVQNDWAKHVGSPVILTGPPGSGKSALIRELITERQKADVTLAAKGQTAERLARQVATTLNLELPTLGFDYAALIQSIKAREALLWLAVDGLDEAAPGEAIKFISQFVLPLSALPKVRLLVGTRRRLDGRVASDNPNLRHKQLRDLFGEDAMIVDLQDDEDAVEDIGRFIKDRLAVLGDQVDEARIDKTASDVAKQSEGNFLYANLVARTLIDKPDLVGNDLPDGAIQAFDFDLSARFGEADVTRALDLLATLAWAKGAGLPRSLWSRVASALSGKGAGKDLGDELEERLNKDQRTASGKDTDGGYTDADVTWLLENAAFHVLEARAETRGEQQTVYRLFHQAIADHLRSRWTLAARRRVITLLIGDLKGEAWLKLDPYFQRHLPTHLAELKLLDRYVSDLGFLSAVEPGVLLATLPNDQFEGPTPASIYERVAERLVDLAPLDRMPLIHMAAEMNRYGLEKEWTPSPLCGWKTVWSNTRQSSQHRVLVRMDGLTSMDLYRSAELGFLYAGKANGTIKSWNLAESEIPKELERAHFASVSALASVVAGPRPLLASASMDGRVKIFEPSDLSLLFEAQIETRWYDYALNEGRFSHFGFPPALAVAVGDGVAGLVAGPFEPSDEGENIMIAWSVSPDGHVAEIARTALLVSSTFAAAYILGDLYAFVAEGSAVRRMNLTTATLNVDFRCQHEDPVTALAAFWTDDDLLILCGDDKGVVHVWDGRTSDPKATKIDCGLPVEMLSCVKLDRTYVVVSTNNDIRLYDLATGLLAVGPIEGFSGNIVRASVIRDPVEPRLITASTDGTVRSWSLEELKYFVPVDLGFLDEALQDSFPQPQPEAPDTELPVRQFVRGYLTKLTRHNVTFTSGYDAAIDYDPKSETLNIYAEDQPLTSPISPYGPSDNVLAIARLDGQLVFARADERDIVIMDAWTGTPFGIGRFEGEMRWTDLALVMVGGTPFLLATGEEDGFGIDLLTGDLHDLSWSEDGLRTLVAANVGDNAIVALLCGRELRCGTLMLREGTLRFEFELFETGDDARFAGPIAIGEGKAGPYVVASTSGGVLARFDPLKRTAMEKIRIGEPVLGIWCVEPSQVLIEVRGGMLAIAYQDEPTRLAPPIEGASAS